MGKIATRDAYGQALVQYGKDDNRIVVLDADLAAATKTGVFKKDVPERFFDMGIAEGNMMGVAAGLATTGKIVFASTFAVFASERACEQIRNSICYPKLNVKVCATHAGLTVGEDGASHQALEDLAIMRALPNMVVINPCDGPSANKAVKAIIDYEGPCYSRFGRAAVEDVYTGENFTFEIGKANELVAGKDVTLIGTGMMVQESLKAAEILKTEGINARVLDMHTIKPIDKDAIIKAAIETGAIVTAEEYNIIGGLGGAVAEVVCQNYPCPVKMVAVQDKFGTSGAPAELLEMYGITAAEIVKKAKEAIAAKIK